MRITDFHSRSRLTVALILIWVAIFAIALTGLPDLTNNEERVGAYVLDAINNGNWIVPKDLTGDLTSKPPTLTWLAGMTTIATGQLSRFSVYFPTALATLAIALVIFTSGSKWMGWLAGFLAALTYLLSAVTDSQMTTTRYDGLFSLAVLLGGLAAHRAWVLGRGWTWFWLAAAAATMVKGPLGVLLGAAGLMAAFWEWRSGDARRPRGNHLLGIMLYFLICGGWFALAYLQVGQVLIDKMILRELVGNSIASDEGALGSRFHQPMINLFAKFLPWSLLGALAFWRVWKEPSNDVGVRRFERFLVCWIIVGLVVFSFTAHQRSRLILPLVPPLALLVGHELARRLSGLRIGTLRNWLAGLTVIALAGLALQRHVLLAGDKNVKDALALYSMADTIENTVGKAFPLAYLDGSTAIQFCMGSYRPLISVEQAAGLLRGKAAAFVVVKDIQALRGALGGEAAPLYELLVQEMSDDQALRIVSNHPKLEWPGSMEAIFGPLRMRMEGVKLAHQKDNHFIFDHISKDASRIDVTNDSSSPQSVVITLRTGGGSRSHEKRLAPGESWQL